MQGKLLNMEGEDKSLFSKLVALGCGETVSIGCGMDSPLEELIGLARVADRYQVEAVQGDVEEALMDRLTVDSCGRILMTAWGVGLCRWRGQAGSWR